MAESYRVDLENTSGNTVAIFQDFRSLIFNIEISDKGNYQLALSAFDDRISLFGDDYLVRVWFQDEARDIDWVNIFTGIHKTFTRGMSTGGQRTFISFGPSLEEILDKAHVLYPTGLTTRARKNGIVSTVMYSYVQQNVGSTALAGSGRDIDHVNPISNAPDIGIGPSWSGIRARKNLLSVLRDIRDYSIQQDDQVDYRVNYLGNYLFQFEVYLGDDRTDTGVSATSSGLNSAENVPVVFGPNYRNVQQFTRSKSRFNEGNVIVALGQATDTNRQKAIASEALSLAASPIAQREMVSNAVNEDNIIDLLARADSRLQEKIGSDRFGFEPATGAAQIIWRDFFPGDFITGEDEDGTRFNKQITSLNTNVRATDGGVQIARTNIGFTDK